MNVMPPAKETERQGIVEVAEMEAAEVVESCTRPDLVVELLEEDWRSRIRNPLLDPEAERAMFDQRGAWAREGKTVVFTSGAYDLLHLDHAAYLLDTKLQGAASHYRRQHEAEYGLPWENLPEETQSELAGMFLRADELRLVVSVDGNNKIARRKSGKAEKGGGARPILDWESRARLLATLSIDNGGGSRPIVDAITINDPVDLGGTPHEDLFEQAAWLQPDVWAAYHESEYIFDEAPLDHRLRFVEIRKISKIDYFGDALLEGKAGTTAILKRIQKA